MGQVPFSNGWQQENKSANNFHWAITVLPHLLVTQRFLHEWVKLINRKNKERQSFVWKINESLRALRNERKSSRESPQVKRPTFSSPVLSPRWCVYFYLVFPSYIKFVQQLYWRLSLASHYHLHIRHIFRLSSDLFWSSSPLLLYVITELAKISGDLCT